MFRQIAEAGGHQVSKMLKVNLQPDGPVLAIVRCCKPTLTIASAKRASMYVLVVDREQLGVAAGNRARAIAAALRASGAWPFDITVVVKDRALENWLVADLEALRRQPRRFSVSASMVRRVEPDHADSVDALALLKQAAVGPHYDKKVDGARIAAHQHLEVAARHSRSLRHLLHVLNHPLYAVQCSRAVVP